MSETLTYDDLIGALRAVDQVFMEHTHPMTPRADRS